MKESTFRIAAAILIIFAVVIGFLVITGDTIGISLADTRDFITVLPGVAAILMAFYAISISSGEIKTAVIGGTGLAFVVLVYLMNKIDFIIPDLGISLSDLSFGLILLFLVIAAATAWQDRY